MAKKKQQLSCGVDINNVYEVKKFMRSRGWSIVRDNPREAYNAKVCGGRYFYIEDAIRIEDLRFEIERLNRVANDLSEANLQLAEDNMQLRGELKRFKERNLELAKENVHLNTELSKVDAEIVRMNAYIDDWSATYKKDTEGLKVKLKRRTGLAILGWSIIAAFALAVCCYPL